MPPIHCFDAALELIIDSTFSHAKLGLDIRQAEQ